MTGRPGPLESAVPASPLVLTGLANGQTYTVRLKAYNSLLFQSGPSLASNAVSVTPQGVPGAPTITSASAADGSGTIDFRAGSDGGLPIRTYEYSLDGGSSWTARAPEAASSPLKLTGLANGTTTRWFCARSTRRARERLRTWSL